MRFFLNDAATLETGLSFVFSIFNYMKLYPESASQQLEFEKIKDLLHERCQSEYARNKALDLRIHTKKEFIDRDLKQSFEYKQLIQNNIYFPNGKRSPTP